MKEVVENNQERKRAKDRKSVALSFVPRVMDLETAAYYLGVSYWTVRSLVQNGKIPTVKLPRADGNEPIRRVLILRDDLDQFIDRLPKEVTL